MAATSPTLKRQLLVDPDAGATRPYYVSTRETEELELRSVSSLHRSHLFVGGFCFPVADWRRALSDQLMDRRRCALHLPE